MNQIDQPKTLQQAIVYFADRDNCLKFMVERRWPDGIVKCPTCGSENVSFLSSRRLWQCKTRHPKAQFSIKVGTIFEDSPIGLDKWLMAMWMLANCKNGVSSYEIHRAIGITQKSAWFMLQRLRLVLKDIGPKKLGNHVEPIQMDETYIGGKPKNMHKDKRVKLFAANNGKYPEKTAVFGMLDTQSREVRAMMIPKVKRASLQRVILDNVGFGATIHTDESTVYNGLRWYVHETVNHMNEYVTANGVTTNSIENFWSLLKRSLSGTYVAVEPMHMDRYLDEAMFRFNNRIKHDDGTRFTKAMGQVIGRRLTYAELTGKNAEAAGTF